MFPREVRELIWAYVLLSVGGLMLHLRIHPPDISLFNWLPVAFGIVNMFVLPVLFSRAHTVALGFMICCATVAAGTVSMAYYSIVNWNSPVTMYTVIFKSTLADILILFVKLPLGYAMLRHFQPLMRAPAAEK